MSETSHRIARDVSVHVFTLGRRGARFLMLHRTEHRGGFWQGVTGAPHARETDVQAAIREVREETGFDIRSTIRAIPVSYTYALRPDMASRWEHLYGPGVTSIAVVSFGAEVPAERQPRLDPAEHDDFTWCTYGEAFALLDWPIEQDALPGRHRAFRSLAETLDLTTGGPGRARRATPERLPQHGRGPAERSR